MSDLDATRKSGPPTVTGLSPTEGTPGTQVVIRGENLGVDQDDILMLFICGTDCLHSAKWKSSSKIIARVGQANRGLGEVKIATKSGGRGISHVKFRIFIAQIGPLEESALWVDESRTVPGREAVRVVAQTSDDRDALGLMPSKKMDINLLQKEFPDGSGNLRMESFNPQWYLLENHCETPIEDLREAIRNMEIAKAGEDKKNEQIHKSNLYSLINCVDTLAALHDEIEKSDENGDFKIIKNIANEISEARNRAENVFKDVLSRKDKADATRNALSVLTRFKFIFFLSKSIDDNIKKGEYLTILNDYTRAKALYKNTTVPLFQEVMQQLDAKMEDFKEEVKHKLIDTPASYEEQSKLIKYLKILEPDSDPTWECIRAYHCWLEDIMWKIQGDHHAKAVEAAKSRSNGRFSMVETDERQLFVANITSVLSNKLQSFWKLSSSYNTSDSRWTQHQEDINMMLTNTLNAASWLILNALIPELLPPEKTQMYASKFVKWPEVSPKLRSIVLVNCLKTIRGFITNLLECQFSNYQIQPLLEISMMIRMKVIANVIEKTIDNIQLLYKKENWQQEFFDTGVSKTPLPDLYENEVCECISSIRDALATNGYPGESCLFSKEQYRTELIRFFVEVLRSIKKCIEILLGQRKVPMKLQDPSKWEDEENTQITPRKLLISIYNLEYIMESSLTNISKRMNDSGIKYADVIFEHSRKILGDYRRILIEEMYIRMKLQMFQGLVESCNYDYIPDEDVSDYAKEMMMCFVLQQAELELHSPQMTLDCIQMTVQRVIELLLGHISDSPPKTTSAIQQCVIDLEMNRRDLLNLLQEVETIRETANNLQFAITSIRNRVITAIEGTNPVAEPAGNLQEREPHQVDSHLAVRQPMGPNELSAIQRPIVIYQSASILNHNLRQNVLNLDNQETGDGPSTSGQGLMENRSDGSGSPIGMKDDASGKPSFGSHKRKK